MFKKLREKWKVGPARLALVLLTFAIGGSLTGWLGRKLLWFLGIEPGVAFVILYVLLITILWPMMVILVSLPLGQFPFFRSYLARLGQKIFKQNNDE